MNQSAKRRPLTISQRVVLAQEEERRRLSADLHDSVGTRLAAAQLHLAAIENTVRGVDPPMSAMLQDARQLLTEAIVSMREICGELRPSMLHGQDLPRALQEWAQRLGRRGDMTVRFTQESFDAGISSEVASALYRIAQEALTNCTKHAEARVVEIELASVDRCVRLTIADDGVGFDSHTMVRPGRSPGLGLLSMRERAERAGGTFNVESDAGRGTRVVVEFPLTTQRVGA